VAKAVNFTTRRALGAAHIPCAVNRFHALGIARDEQVEHCHAHTAHAWHARLFSSHGFLVIGSELACLIGHLHRELHVNFKKTTAASAIYATMPVRGRASRHHCNGAAITRNRSMPVPPHATSFAARRLTSHYAQHTVASDPALHVRPFFSSETTQSCVRDGILRTRWSVDAASSTVWGRSAYRVAMLPVARRRVTAVIATILHPRERFRSAVRSVRCDHPHSAESTSDLGSAS
jgi:hypothetical protein